MKKIICSIALGMVLVQSALCWDYQYEVTKSTYNFGVFSISSAAPVLVSLTPAQTAKSSGDSYHMYSVSLFNISASSAVYMLNGSTSSSAGLTCASGAIIGAGTETVPYVVTEKFEGLYMWALACGNSDITNARRVIRGR